MKVSRRSSLLLMGSAVAGATASTQVSTGLSGNNQNQEIETIWERGFTSPVEVDLVNETLYAASIDRVFAIDPASGDFNWSTELDEKIATIIGNSSGVFVGTDKGVTYLDDNGSVQWNRPVGSVLNFALEDDIAYTVAEDSGGESGIDDLVALDTDGNKVWSIDTEFGIEPQITIHNDAIVAIKNGAYPASRSDKPEQLISLSLDDGEENWSLTPDRESDRGGYSDLTTRDGSIYFTQRVDLGAQGRAARLHKITAGNVDWRKQVDDDMPIGYSSGSHRIQMVKPVVTNSGIYAQGSNRTLAKYSDTDGTEQWSSSTEVENITDLDEGVIVTTILDGSGEIQKFSSNGLQEWTYQFGSDYSSLDQDTFEGFGDLYPLPNKDMSFVFVDHDQERLLSVGSPQDAAQDDSPSEDDLTQNDSDTTGEVQDDEEDSQPEPRSSEESRDLFFPGDNLGNMGNINTTMISAGGLVLSIVGIVYTMVTQKNG